jgi:DtxR family Mn-dependent transcriptional regulator
MARSPTVENYLKAIYQAQAALDLPGAYVPMGQLASALDVVPGTATTMVKALAESGLVTYEPYVGVRLTAAGEKLAALVLRRHRLIELFLVEVMGMSWAEVHAEAEQLEHAVSDRLIERIDEMLGHPDVDPHGDPIPNAEGEVPSRRYESLLTCPLRRPVRVTRISDQDADFLRFIESHELKPGTVVVIEERDAAADRVRLKRGRRRITIGTRAAGKLLVQVALFACLLVAPAAGQGAASAGASARPFEIRDNSFLVEEAFNQEAGIVQNIGGFVRRQGAWTLLFTQEWPLGSQAHQLAYTLPFSGGAGAGTGMGDAAIHYRYQALFEAPARPAFSPRLSVILPTGGRRGAGAVGYQVNLPFSKQFGDLYLHWGAGLTGYPGVTAEGEARAENFVTPHASGSVIWRARPMMHPMIEVLFESEERPRARESRLTVAPGLRAGRNLGDAQVVVGVALPVALEADAARASLLLHLSYELPFRR